MDDIFFIPIWGTIISAVRCMLTKPSREQMHAIANNDSSYDGNGTMSKNLFIM